MTQLANIDIAETVALVTFSMTEILSEYCEKSLPGRYRYHLFEGFPGFCDYAGAAGLAMAVAFCDHDVDTWIDIVDEFSRKAVSLAVAGAKPCSNAVLTRLARAVRRRAVRNGVAFAVLRTNAA